MKHFLVIGNILRKVRVAALIDGARRFGLEPLFYRSGEEKKIVRLLQDEEIMFGVSVGMRASDAFVKGVLEDNGINTLILDLGYLSRAKGPHDETGYNQLGINQLCWITPEHCDDSRLKRHNVSFEPVSMANNRVALVLGQVPGDTQHGLSPSDLKAWLLREMGKLAAQGYQLEYRPHPKASAFLSHYRRKLFEQVYLSSMSSLEQNICSSDVVLTYNSTAGLTALAMGRRVISSPVAHYHGVFSRAQVYDHFCRVAWSQWTCEELRNGSALDYMSRFDNRFIGETNGISTAKAS